MKCQVQYREVRSQGNEKVFRHEKAFMSEGIYDVSRLEACLLRSVSIALLFQDRAAEQFDSIETKERQIEIREARLETEIKCVILGA